MQVPRNGVISESEHHRIAELIATEVGIQLPPHKRKLVETRLSKRLKETQYSNVSAYLDYCLSHEGANEKVSFIDALTTNKTDFFREMPHFEFLQEWVLSKAKAFSRHRPMRAWSAACSTGEEPYTLAMLLAHCQSVDTSFDYSIMASDISTEVLASAKRAIYNQAQISGIPQHYRKRYLLRTRANVAPARFKICREVRSKVQFEHINLMQNKYPYEGMFDVIFCRNVLIYFSGEDRLLVIKRLTDCLSEGGLLIMGLSESIGQNRDLYEAVGPTIYRKHSSAAMASVRR